MIGRMKEWEGRTPSRPSERAFTSDDDDRIWPLAEVREARLLDRGACFVCGADRAIGGVDPVIASVTRGRMIRFSVCSSHAKLDSWPPADQELAEWMLANGWGEPMDPAMLGGATQH